MFESKQFICYERMKLIKKNTGENLNFSVINGVAFYTPEQVSMLLFTPIRGIEDGTYRFTDKTRKIFKPCELVKGHIVKKSLKSISDKYDNSFYTELRLFFTADIDQHFNPNIICNLGDPKDSIEVYFSLGVKKRGILIKNIGKKVNFLVMPLQVDNAEILTENKTLDFYEL